MGGRVTVVAVAMLCAIGGGCGGSEAPESDATESTETDSLINRSRAEYLVAARPAVEQRAYRTCLGHTPSSLGEAEGFTVTTAGAAAREVARNQIRDDGLLDAAYRGCLKALRETAELPDAVPTDTEPIQPPADRRTQEQIDIYLIEYSICSNATVEKIGKDYGFDVRGMTKGEVALAMARETYRHEFQQVAYEGCFHGLLREPSRYQP